MAAAVLAPEVDGPSPLWAVTAVRWRAAALLARWRPLAHCVQRAHQPRAEQPSDEGQDVNSTAAHLWLHVRLGVSSAACVVPPVENEAQM